MEKERTQPTAEQKAKRRAGRLIGQVLWRQNFVANNPGASKEDQKAAWEGVKKEHSKTGAQVLKVLEKSGFVLQHVPGEKPAKSKPDEAE